MAPTAAIPCEDAIDGKKTDPNRLSLSTECTLHLPFRLIAAGDALPTRDVIRKKARRQMRPPRWSAADESI